MKISQEIKLLPKLKRIAHLHIVGRNTLSHLIISAKHVMLSFQFVGQQYYGQKLTGPIFMKPGRKVQHGPRKNPLNLSGKRIGADLNE